MSSNTHSSTVLLALPALLSSVSVFYLLIRLAFPLVILSATSLKAGRVISSGATGTDGVAPFSKLVNDEGAALALDGFSILAFRLARLVGIFALLSLQIYGLSASDDASPYYFLGVYVMF